jgi:DNA mismatch repair protein MutS
MVEMIETASIMNNLSNRSLILLDEIGRGTSTYDGISIAWSIVEFLHGDPSKPKTLFATHYHELSQLADKHERIENYNVAVKEHGDRIIFLRKLVKGSTNQSFGIKVALMSGLPRKIISRADQILHLLQENTVEHHPVDKETLGKLPVQNGHGQHQLQMFPQDPVKLNILEELQLMNVQAMTPIECLLKLNELSQKLKD